MFVDNYNYRYPSDSFNSSNSSVTITTDSVFLGNPRRLVKVYAVDPTNDDPKASLVFESEEFLTDSDDAGVLLELELSSAMKKYNMEGLKISDLSINIVTLATF